ncbi:MAG TPA: ParB/RepB/Spo0J family partition protein [bacterium]|jgi:hypothetical protein|nr:ParB-like nuclease domain-containing protein [Dictyoglomota bacterium]HHV81739.1 ParB N-terminal domain-containing protein [bacterium]HON72492.1 ParB/RepB/Spo0J family partition protein [bacterium]HPC78097.1 ParB/RepB/Spo0J family partition protein [bacterium]HPO82166.1 ParB/RepB/Spo0J family partition protein [bacterium]
MKRVDNIRSLQEEYGGLGYLRVKDTGVHPIEVDKIIGSVGRPQDLDSNFRFKWRRPTERYLTIKKMMEEGKILPPIEVYKIRDEYYVLDGHHRVAAAKELRQKFIDAHIFQAYPLRPRREDILYSYRESFREKTGLDIPLTEPSGYENFLSQIEDYAKRNNVSFKEAVSGWYKEFLEDCRLIKREKVDRIFRDKTIGDLYLYVCTHKWYKSEEQGREVTFKEALKSFKKLYGNGEESRLRFLKWIPVRLWI